MNWKSIIELNGEDFIKKSKNKGVYKIYFTHNKSICYIGSTVMTIHKRITTHLCSLKRGSHHSKYLQNVYNKYGMENIRFEVIEICNSEDVRVKELYWINYFNCIKNGYNSDSWTVSYKPYKRKINTINYKYQKLLKYDLNGLFIEEVVEKKKLTDFVKKSSCINPNLLKNSNHTCMGFLWREYSENYPLLISEHKRNTRKPVICYDLKGDFICVFKSILEASKILNLPVGRISTYFMENGKRCSNYIFKRYTENYLIKIQPFSSLKEDKKQVKVTYLKTNIISVFNCREDCAKHYNISKCKISNYVTSNKILKKLNIKFEYI